MTEREYLSEGNPFQLLLAYRDSMATPYRRKNVIVEDLNNLGSSTAARQYNVLRNGEYSS